jgi:ABC-type branched-subunit amino acid transport system substrate-binding protein/tetratricopeptide (TPR) repeat protein
LSQFLGKREQSCKDSSSGECTRGSHRRQDSRGQDFSRPKSRRQGFRPVQQWLTIALLALLTCAPTVDAAFEGARYLRDAERQFTKGITAYDNGDLQVARDSFQSVADLPANQRSGAALLMLARTLLAQGAAAEQGPEASMAYNAAISVARELTRKAPNSRYAADARLLAGDAYYQLKRRYEAATEYARILEGTAALAVMASAAERLAAIVGNRDITASALQKIRDQLGGERLQDALLFGEARWYGRLGWEPQSRKLYAAYADSVGPNGMFHNLAQSGIRGQQSVVERPVNEPARVEQTLPAEPPDQSTTAWVSEAGREDLPRIGVLVPLTGPKWERDIGRDLLAGARMANDEMGEPFELVPIDTGSEYFDFEGQPLPFFQSEASRMVRVVAGTRFLIDEVGVVAIIGPAFSTSCAAAAGIAESAGVPLIAPLAQQSGLDTLGTHLFQLEPIPEMQGRALAEYATLVLGLETLAILSPMSDYGHGFEQAFAEAAIRNGGRVLHSDWYFPEATDFHAQFDSLRQKGFRLMPAADGDSLALFDSLETVLLDTSVAGDWMFEELVRAQGLDQAPSRRDSSDIFIDSIDGVVIVAGHFEDATRVAPQLRSHRLHTRMLGNDTWNNPERLAELPRTERVHLVGATFVSRRQGSQVEQEFIDRYRLRTRRDDSGYAAAGFDAANLLLQGWSSGLTSRADLRQFLADVRDYEGASGRISFTAKRRANSEMTLLTIADNGLIRPLRAEDLPRLEVELVDADLPAGSLPDPAWETAEDPR